MKQFLVSILFLFLSVFSNGCNGYPKPKAPLIEMSQETVALTYLSEDGTTVPFCTAVWVNSTTILTANHCVESLAESKETVGVEKLEVSYSLQEELGQFRETPHASHLSRVLAVNVNNDLALLRALSPVPIHKNAILASSPPAIEEHLHFLGNPGGLTFTYVQGSVSAYRDSLPTVDFNGPFMQVSAPIWKGNSGGGAFNDKGELCGISSFIMASIPYTAFYIHLNTIRKFLLDNKIN